MIVNPHDVFSRNAVPFSVQVCIAKSDPIPGNYWTSIADTETDMYTFLLSNLMTIGVFVVFPLNYFVETLDKIWTKLIGDYKIF